MKILKEILISMAFSFIIVFCGWLCFKFFYDINNFIGFLGAFWGWFPGFLILAPFVGAWQAIHLDRWLNLIPVVSFAFWVVLIFVLRKIHFLIKRRFLLRRNS